MIVICPNCATKFLVDPVALGPDGRRVRCARCAHIWFQERPPDVEVVPPQSFASGNESFSATPTRNLPATAEQLLARRSTIAAGWVILALVVIGLAAVAFLGRNQIVAFWPPAIQLYDTLGIEVAEGHPERLFGAGLSVRNVGSEVVEGEDGGPATIIIRGEVVNESDVARPVPPLKVRLVNNDGEALHEWVFAITDAPLDAGAAEPFETSLSDLDPSVTKLEILPADGEAVESPTEPAHDGEGAGAGDAHTEDPADHATEHPAAATADHPADGADSHSDDDAGHGATEHEAEHQAPGDGASGHDAPSHDATDHDATDHEAESHEAPGHATPEPDVSGHDAPADDAHEPEPHAPAPDDPHHDG